MLAVVMLAGCMGMTAFAEEALGEAPVDEAELGGDAAGAVLPEGGSPDVSEGESVGFEPVPEETVPEETAEGPELPEAEEQVVEDETGTDVDETVSFEAKSSLDEDFTGICAEGSGNYAQPDDADPAVRVMSGCDHTVIHFDQRLPVQGDPEDLRRVQAASPDDILIRDHF